MPVHLYHFEGSPPCHSVRLLAKTLDLDLNLIYVDYLKGENMDQKFGQKNPLHTVPTIDDDGFMVAESRVILGYLAEKYDESGSLYPKDLQKRTIVNQRLYFDLGTLYQSYREYYGEVFRTGRLGEPARLAKVEKAFQVLNRYLEQNAWVAGDDLTIADFTVVSSVAAIDTVGDFNVSKYEHIWRWYEKAAQEMKGFEEIIVEGSKKLREFFDEYKKK